jgi:hypothetical protein
MRMPQEALDQSRLDHEALRRNREVMSRVVVTSPAGMPAATQSGDERILL